MKSTLHEQLLKAMHPEEVIEILHIMVGQRLARPQIPQRELEVLEQRHEMLGVALETYQRQQQVARMIAFARLHDLATSEFPEDETLRQVVETLPLISNSKRLEQLERFILAIPEEDDEADTAMDFD